MKKFIPAFGFLLLAAPCFATVTNYHWEGSITSGNIPETTVSGSFTTDDSAPLNPDESLNGVKTYDGGLSNISLNIGDTVYNDFNHWSWMVPADGKGFGFSDAPLAYNPNGYHINDLIFANLSEEQDWDVWYTPDGHYQDQIFGKVTRLWADATPTPEPSSFLLLAFAIGAGAIYKKVTRKPI